LSLCTFKKCRHDAITYSFMRAVADEVAFVKAQRHSARRGSLQSTTAVLGLQMVDCVPEM
jgi:hypothetical protein